MGHHLLKTYGRPVKMFKRPIERKVLLDNYIKDTDTIYRKDLIIMGYNDIAKALKRYVQFHKDVKAINPIDLNTWEILR
jgi:hypothetical protein